MSSVTRSRADLWRRVIKTASLAVSVLLITPQAVACAPHGATPSDSPDIDAFLEPILQDAIDGGANDSQIAILQEAMAANEVSLEVARVAAHAAIECMAESGLSASYTEYEQSNSLLVPNYDVLLSRDPDDVAGIETAEAIVARCDTAEFRWINEAYQTQPSSVELTDALLEERSDELRACLEEAGRNVDTQATPRELAEEAVSLAIDTNWQVHCLSDAGIDGF